MQATDSSSVTQPKRRRRARRLGLSTALLLSATIVATFVFSSGGPSGITGPHRYGTGAATYQLLVTPPQPGDSRQVTEQQARQALDHPVQYSLYSTMPRLIVFGFGRVTALSLSGPAPLETYSNRPAWVGVYEVPSTAVEARECGARGPGGPSPHTKPPAKYYFARVIDPDTGQQALWNENASLILAWRCSSKGSW